MTRLKVYAWGANSHGQTGTGKTEEELLTPVPVILPQELSLASSPSQPLPSETPLEADCTARLAGRGGGERLNFASLALDGRVLVTGGGGHTVLLAGGRVFTCGLNDEGQLGRPSKDATDPQLRPVILEEPVSAVACGWDHTLFLTASGRVLASGSNRHGQCALPADPPPAASKRRTTAKPTSNEASATSCPASQGPAVCEEPQVVTESGPTKTSSDISSQASRVEVAGLPRIQRIAAGLRHSAAVSDQGRLYTWGDNSRGQCGVTSQNQRNLTSPRLVDSLSGVTEVACGQRHTVAIVTEDAGRCVYGMGDNRRGQISPAVASSDSAVKQRFPEPSLVEMPADVTPSRVHCGWTHTVLETESGPPIGWGRGDYGQLALPRQRLRQLSLGSEHAVALTADGRVLTWGWNEHGNCGTGNISNVMTSPEDISASVDGTVVAVGAGYGCSFALTFDAGEECK